MMFFPVKSPATSDISISFFYNFVTPCQENFSVRVAKYVFEQIQATNKEWPGLCNDQYNMCTNVNVSIVCQAGISAAYGQVFIKGSRYSFLSPFTSINLVELFLPFIKMLIHLLTKFFSLSLLFILLIFIVAQS